MLSIVVPVHNEERSILPLYDRLTSVLLATGRSYEIIFIDDASTDRSLELLSNLVLTDVHPQPKRALVDAAQAITLEELPSFLEDCAISREAYEKRCQARFRDRPA